MNWKATDGKFKGSNGQILESEKYDRYVLSELKFVQIKIDTKILTIIVYILL